MLDKILEQQNVAVTVLINLDGTHVMQSFTFAVSVIFLGALHCKLKSSIS